MTCIVGIEHGGRVFLGGDSAAVAGWDTRIQAAPKVFELGEFVMGYTTSFRMGQLLQYEFSPPENDGGDDMTHMVTRFVPALRDCMRDGGFTAVKDGQESAGQFLVGYRGKLYRVCDDFAVLRSHDGYEAIGLGEKYALAVMWREARAVKEMDPAIAMEAALEAAAYFSNGVSGPFAYVVTGSPFLSKVDLGHMAEQIKAAEAKVRQFEQDHVAKVAGQLRQATFDHQVRQFEQNQGSVRTGRPPQGGEVQ